MPSDPLILAFDTSAAHVAAALLSGDQIVADHFEEMPKGQAEALMPCLEAVLAKAGVAWADLTALGVGIGPGNFTGIRISVSAARGLALGLGIPAVGVSVLDAQAFDMPHPIVSVLDARRGAVYFRVFGQDESDATLGVEADVPSAMSRVGFGGDQPAVPLSHALAHLAAAGRGVTPPAPLYLRAPDAAPGRDQGVVILP